MGRMFRYVLTASALLQPLGAGVSASTLHAERLTNDELHASPNYYKNSRSTAALANINLFTIFANAARAKIKDHRAHSTPSKNGSFVEVNQNANDLSLNRQILAATALIAGDPSGWDYIGCFDGDVSIKASMNFGFYWNPENGVTLPAPQFMSSDICTASCSLSGIYFYAGLSGNTCYCFNDRPADSDVPLTCDTPCYGNEGESCGGGDESSNSVKLTVYTRGNIPDYSPASAAAPTGWQYEGCYALEGYAYIALADGRSFGYDSTEGTLQQSVELCTTTCSNNGFWVYAGMMGSGCFCSNSPPEEWAVFSPEYCQAQCPGSPDQACGGLGFTDWYVSVYSRTFPFNLYPPTPMPSTEDGPWYYKGCYDKRDNNEMSTYGIVTINSNLDNAAAATCIQACNADSNHYPLAGLFNSECFCAKKTPRDLVTPSDDCNTGCSGNPSEPCGGNANTVLTLYGRNLDNDLNNPDSIPLLIPGSALWQDKGCYQVPKLADISKTVAYTYRDSQNPNMSPETCIPICKANRNWKYAIAWSEGTCLCTDALPSGSPIQGNANEDAVCNFQCLGHDNELCGGDQGGFGYARFWQNPLNFIPTEVPVRLLFSFVCSKASALLQIMT